ncbi:MAG: hypothetical protein QNK37_37540 [Acidobacteriota bacterium]|nr:hypothetical protein [Acidobacteriota bacterium]
MFVGIARGYRPTNPELLLDEILDAIRDKPDLVFHHEAAIVSYVKRAMYYLMLDKKKRDRHTVAVEENMAEAQMAFPPLHEVFASLRGYDGPLPLRDVSDDRPKENDDMNEARERSITVLIEDFRNNLRERASGLVPLFRQILDPVWDEMFAERYPEHHPISNTLSEGLDRVLIRALFSLPLSAGRDQIQEALAEVGEKYIPVGVGDVQRGVADDRETMLTHFMTVHQYMTGLQGEDRAYGKAIVLFHVDDMSHQEVADAMGITRKQARTLVRKGMDGLIEHCRPGSR